MIEQSPDRSVFAGRSHQTDAGDEVLLAAEEIADNIVDSYSRRPTHLTALTS
jgi:hypothetical protein